MVEARVLPEKGDRLADSQRILTFAARPGYVFVWLRLAVPSYGRFLPTRSPLPNRLFQVDLRLI